MISLTVAFYQNPRLFRLVTRWVYGDPAPSHQNQCVFVYVCGFAYGERERSVIIVIAAFVNTQQWRSSSFPNGSQAHHRTTSSTCFPTFRGSKKEVQQIGSHKFPTYLVPCLSQNQNTKHTCCCLLCCFNSLKRVWPTRIKERKQVSKEASKRASKQASK